MPDQISHPTERSALLDRYVAELIRLATTQYPGASVEILPVPFEDEDAHILVYVPEETGETELDRLSDVLTERSVEMLLDTGLFILIGVYEASQRQPSTAESTTDS
jgi:hypothetical protein